MKKIIGILSVSLILSGCLTYQEYSFKFDFNSGKAEKVYHDIRSQKGVDEKDYSLEGDWVGLQELAGEDFGKEFDRDVIKPITAELFQEENVLSGREVFEVQAPKAFPSKTAILERLHKDGNEEFEFKILNGEIFMFVNSGKIKTANGDIIKTEKNYMVVWPEEQVVFEFVIDKGGNRGESLLPFYLKEKEMEKGHE